MPVLTTVTAPSGSLPTRGSGLVSRLVQARNDPGNERIRIWLIDLDDALLPSGLGRDTLRNPRRPRVLKHSIWENKL